MLSSKIDFDAVHENLVGGSSMIGFPLVIADSERDLPGIQGWAILKDFIAIPTLGGQNCRQLVL